MSDREISGLASGTPFINKQNMKIGFILIFVFISGISFGQTSGVITARDKDVVNGKVAEIPQKVRRNFDKLFKAWKTSWQAEMVNINILI